MVTIPLLNRAKTLDPLAQYKLKTSEKLEMVGRGAVLSQIAVPIGSALYFLWFQMHYLFQYQEPNGTYGSFINVWLKDPWDRLPVHIQNLFHSAVFGIHSQAAPLWWVTARHDFRKVLIGFIAALLIGSITVGFKKYERASVKRMILSVPVALTAAGAVATGLIAFFAVGLPKLANWIAGHPVNAGGFGLSGGGNYVLIWLGKGQIELLVIGIISGIIAKKILARTFATIQLMSIERNIAQHDPVPTGVRRLIYGANYVNRYEYILAEVEAGRHEVQLGRPVIGIAIASMAPGLAFLAGFGIWLNYFGPAAGAH